MVKNLSITVTFKSEEQWIYDEICSHSSKAGYIKDAVIAYIKNESKKTTNASNTVESKESTVFPNLLGI